MDIQKQFNLVAGEYDKNRRKFIPCFDDFYCGTTNLIAYNIAEPKRVLDLGAGTGLLSQFWVQHYLTAEFVLVDIADEMLDVARKRFAGMDNVTYQVLNYTNELPCGNFDVIASALSIHHLEDEDKQNLFAQIYDQLPSGGLFVNYDQFCAEQPEMDQWINSYWENQLVHSGLTAHDIALWRERKKLDRECSVEQEIAMLEKAQFKTVQCVYSCQKFSVIVAVK
ncbi:MAG: class I SAM-dependent methyltransferase [Acutalibacter sp.]|nr:class I SAM-dependent methyltransferase [Acutalibacter sp.]